MDSSLIFNPYILLLGSPTHQNFGKGEEGTFPIHIYWNKVILTTDFSCFYFKKVIFRNSWTGMTYISGLESEIVWHTHTHTHTHKHTHTHTHTHTIYIFLQIVGRTLYCLGLNLIPTRFCLLLCYILLVHESYFRFQF